MYVGGSKLATAVVRADGRVLGRGRVEVLRTEDPESFFSALLTCARTAMAVADVTYADLAGVGCGCGGPMIWPEGVVSPLNIPAWRDFPLRARLTEEFGRLPVAVHNDAVALVVGEHWLGSAAGYQNVLGLTVSTGVGGGLVLDGRLFHGSTGNAGHIGHMTVEPGGPVCGCGARGCLEAIASGPNAVRRALVDGWSPPLGMDADGRTLVQTALNGNRIAMRALDHAGSAVGTALASCASLLDLQIVTVAGGFSLAGELFWDALRRSFAENSAFPFAHELRIVHSNEPREIAVLGAAAFILATDRYGWLDRAW
jgi:glucokinase